MNSHTLVYGWKLSSETVRNWVLSKNPEEEMVNFMSMDEFYKQYFPDDWQIEGFDHNWGEECLFSEMNWFLSCKRMKPEMTIKEIAALPQTFTDGKLLTLFKELNIKGDPKIQSVSHR